MHTFQKLKAHNPVETGESFVISGFGFYVVARSVRMAGIDAYAHPAFVLHAVDDGCQMFEAIAEVCALSGGIFDNRSYAPGFVQDNVNGFGNSIQTGFFGYLFQM